MIYNHYLYTREYVENEVDRSNEYLQRGNNNWWPMARIYVRKNKDGEAHDYRHFIWDSEVPDFVALEDYAADKVKLTSRPMATRG